MRRKSTALILLILFSVGLACQAPFISQPAPGNLSAEDRVNTSAAQTVAALGTLVAQGKNPTLGPGTLVAPVTAVPPTQANNTPVPASSTPPPANATSTVSDVPCNRASFVRDVTIPDDSVITPNSVFTKIWELKNTGSCTWDSTYSVVFAGRGDALSGPASTLFPDNTKIQPGQSVQIAVAMRSPDKLGDYKGYWMLRSGDNKLFGLGEKGAAPFYVQMKVAEQYSFAEQLCSAQWSTAAGPLPCPGKDSDTQGFVIRQDDPTLEDNEKHEGKGIFTMPQPVAGGTIIGRYPPVMIPNKSDFRATLSCVPSASGCYAHIKVTYQANNGEEKILGEWNEGYEGGVTEIVKDLNMVQGQVTAFNIYITASGTPGQSGIIWFDPRIVK